ncbi:MAG TPA: sugar nucleotide-binding protein [Pyrinomonadaceae bacterium]|jgi:dTDP-4-dehydrorhamnose reductase
MPATSNTPATVIVGADSLIGLALMNELQQTGARVIGTTRRREALDDSHVYLDLAVDVEEWASPVPATVAVICAGMTGLEACERDPVATGRVNVQGVLTVAKSLAATGAFVIYLSSNAVFDGAVHERRASDRVSPVTEYGRQKALVEKSLMALGSNVSIVRLTKVLKPRTGLLAGWHKSLKRGEVVHPFRDMVMAPLPLSFVTGVLSRLIELRLPGIMQVSAARDVTYAEAARHIARSVGAAPELVQPVSFTEAGITKSAAPEHTTLDTTRLRAELELEPPDVWETIISASGL